MDKNSDPARVDVSQIEADLKKFLFREAIEEVEVNHLASLAVYKEYHPGELILAEGATNDALYFLIQGSVDVIHQGEKIATLSTPGEILGEMSLITKKACGASNYASSPCLLLLFQPSQVIHLPSHLQVIFTNALNQLFLGILAKRLSKTNEKARLFEIANRDLIAANWALEGASLTRIDELSTSQKTLVGSIQSILKSRIPTVRELSSQLSTQLDGGTQIWSSLQAEINQVFSEFEDMCSLLNRESSLENTSILLVEQDINEQVNAKMSLIGTGVNFKVVGELEAAKKILQENQFDVVCLNHSFVELIAFAKDLGAKSQFVFVTSEPISKHFSTLRKYPEFSTILARHPDDRSFTVKNISTTIRKLSNNDLFGMEKYLSWGTKITQSQVTGSNQRHELVANLEEFMKSIDIRSSLRGKAIRVAEEILMNTIYDAPTTSDGRPKYNHLARTQKISLEPSEYAQFNYACDGSLLAISAVDPFGELSRSTVLDHLERCFNGQSLGENSEGKGGGGNGLYQMIQSSSLTVYNVWPKRKTEVIALFNINHQVQKISLHPAFQFFEMKE